MYEIFYNAIIFQDIIRVFSYDNFFPKEYLTLRETILSICKLKRVLVTSFVCLFVCFLPTQEFFTHMEISLLPVNGLQIFTYTQHIEQWGFCRVSQRGIRL